MNCLTDDKKNDLLLKIDCNTLKIDIDLSVPRIIPIKGIDKHGKEIVWHLKVTEKRKLVLL